MSDSDQGSGPDAHGQKSNQADRLVALAEERYSFHQDATGEPFALPHDGPLLARMFRGSRSLRAELAHLYAGEFGKAPSSSALTDALLVLEGRCLQEECTSVSLRVAQASDHTVLDLGTPDGRACVITSEEWRLESTPAIFRRSPLTRALPIPQSPGNLDALRTFLNVGGEDWGLILAWLVSCLFPAVPAPILLLAGEQGSAKSYAARLLVRLVDPSESELRSEPRGVEGWIVSASGSWIVAVDNVSRVGEWFSDALCRAVTGEGLVRRALYTDSDLTVLRFRRRIILTSIDPGALRGDLADRLLRIDLERIPDEERREEQDLEEAFLSARPHILAGLLDLASRVYATLPQVSLDRLPRMADFARICGAVDRVRGTNVLDTYLIRARDVVGDVVDADPVARAIRHYVEDVGSVTLTAGELLEELPTPKRPPKRWPTTPQAIGAALKRLAPSLRAVGVQARQLPRNNRRRPWHLALDQMGDGEPRHERHAQHDQGLQGDDPVTTRERTPSTTSPGRHGVSAGRDGSDDRDEQMREGSDDGDGFTPNPCQLHFLAAALRGPRVEYAPATSVREGEEGWARFCAKARPADRRAAWRSLVEIRQERSAER